MRVLFVSKPIAPPWNDGSKNLVRDVARALVRARPTVLTTEGAPALGPRVRMEPIYASPGRFAPGLMANARVAVRLAKRDDHDLWHFVFAPNPVSSAVARVMKRGRPVVQTVASRPKEPRASLIFGDFVIVLSEWTRGLLVSAGVRADLRVIPPCAPAPEPISEERAQRVREKAGEGYFLYPGDYEVSSGARTVAESPLGNIVFACREKTPRAKAARAELERRYPKHAHLGEVEDMAALVAGAAAIVFPVDDLYGKVDLPIVLLEALSRDVPLVLARGGPLEEITTARFVPPRDPLALAREALRAVRERQGGRELWEARFTPERVAELHERLYEEAT